MCSSIELLDSIVAAPRRSFHAQFLLPLPQQDVHRSYQVHHREKFHHEHQKKLTADTGQVTKHSPRFNAKDGEGIHTSQSCFETTSQQICPGLETNGTSSSCPLILLRQNKSESLPRGACTCGVLHHTANIRECHCCRMRCGCFARSIVIL